MEKEDIDEEQKRTLWVGGIDSQVDEELLYELMLNAGPIQRITIPRDKQTNQSKPYAFVLYEYEESVPYAAELFLDTKLFGQSLRLQNRSTGVGLPSPRQGRMANGMLPSEYSHKQHFSSNSPSVSQSPQRHYTPPDFVMEEVKALDRLMSGTMDRINQQWPSNSGSVSPLRSLSTYMNAFRSPSARSFSGSPSSGGSSLPLLNSSPGFNGDFGISRDGSANRSFQNRTFTTQNTNYQGNYNSNQFNREREGRSRGGARNYDRREDRSREDRSRSNVGRRSYSHDRHSGHSPYDGDRRR